MIAEPLIALVGCGAIARSHISAYRALAERGSPAVVTAAVDVEPGRAAAFAHEFGIRTSTMDLQQVLTDDNVHAVDVCTDNFSHHWIAIAALHAGKHVFLEKPMALNLRDADDVVQATAASDATLMVGHSARFDSASIEMREAIEAGDIGDAAVVEMSSWFGYFWPGGWNAWQIDPARSGGHLVHNGIHDLDLASWFLKAQPSTVFARGITVSSSHLDTFDQFHVVLGFPEGQLAACTFAYAVVPTGLAVRSIRVTGTQGEVCYESLVDEIAWGASAVEHSILSAADIYTRELEHWIECLVTGNAPRVTVEEARSSLAVALAAESSAQTGKVIHLGESGG